MVRKRSQEVVVVGARGQGKDLIGYLEDHDYRILCLLDELPVATVLGYAVVAPQDYDLGCRDAFLAIGYPKDKVAVLEKYRPLALRWQTFIDRRAVVSRHAAIGEGSIVAPFAVIAGDARLGRFVYVGAFSGAGHDSVVGDFCSLMPQSGLGGGVRFGDRSLLGAGARVRPGVAIGADVSIVPNTQIKDPVPDGHCAYGNNPTRMIPLAHLEFVGSAARRDED